MLKSWRTRFRSELAVSWPHPANAAWQRAPAQNTWGVSFPRAHEFSATTMPIWGTWVRAAQPESIATGCGAIACCRTWQHGDWTLGQRAATQRLVFA